MEFKIKKNYYPNIPLHFADIKVKYFIIKAEKMHSDNDKKKMLSFIKRLMLNPCFVNETPLIIEEHVILFFLQNGKALQSTFSSSDFFPNLKWENISNLFFNCLTEEINVELQKSVEKIIYKLIDFQVVNKVIERQMETTKFKNQLMTFLTKILERFEIRRSIDPVLKLILDSIIDKYVSEIFTKRSYTAREIERVERLNLPVEYVINYLKIMMLFGVVGFVRNNLDAASVQQKMSTIGEMKFPNVSIQLAHYKKLVDKYSTFVGFFPKEFLEKCLKMHLSFLDDQFLPATCRLAKIFYAFGKNYKSNIKIDKGAESFGKSWFHIQRRNYKFYGFDNNILDELYRISAENYW